MKPPFWEVTISRRVSAAQAPVIESVNCFGNESDADEYRKRALEADASLRIIIRLVTTPAPPNEMVRRDSPQTSHAQGIDTR